MPTTQTADSVQDAREALLATLDSVEPIGIELLAVSQGVDLDDLPYRDEIARVLEKARIRVLDTQSRLSSR